MKKFVMGIIIGVMAIAIGLSSAQAKRVGGGESVGKQSQSVGQSPATQSAQSPSAMQSAPSARSGTPAAAAPAKPASAWKGMLGGALLGLGLGALLSSMGIGAGLASLISTMLMVGLLAAVSLFIYRMVRRKSENSNARPAFATATSLAPSTSEMGSRVESEQPMGLQTAQVAASSAVVDNSSWGIPADFDTPAFLRHSKTYFIRLQAAWDKADTNDILEFTTPEMFAELRMQIQERGVSANHTDVITLDAQLLGIESSGANHLASVKFSGMIREADNAPAEPFSEVWNLTKPVSGQGGWTLAGIQQLS